MMKHTKRISALMCAMLLIICTSFSAFALTDYKLIDDAKLFSSSQTKEINQALADASSTTGWSVIVYTNTKGVSSSKMEDTYNDYYDKQDFGRNGVLFVIDRGQDNRIIITKGDAMYYFSDQRMDDIKSELKPFLQKEDWYGATMKFIECTEEYYLFGEDDYGTYHNVEIKSDSSGSIVRFIIPCIIISLGVAVLAVVFVSLRYKHHGKSGTYDLRANSTTKLLDRQDVFLTKSVSVTTIQSSSSSGGRSSGGRSGGSSHGSSGSF